jgi:carbon storage regulator
MLILTRRPGEEIRIGEDVTVILLGVKGNQARLGIQAPRSVTVDREEVHKQKKRDAQDAAQNGKRSKT